MALRPPLTLARTFSRLDFTPKELNYYAVRVQFALGFYPEPYSNWKINPTSLELEDLRSGTSLTATSQSLGFRNDRPDELEDYRRHIRDACASYMKQAVRIAEPSRFGWRAIFVTEGVPFDDLFDVFRRNTTQHERSWVQLGGYSIRDLGFSTIHYGSPEDGVNLTIGVLTPEQARDFVADEKFEPPPSEPLKIDRGCLLIDLDRYVQRLDGLAGIDKVLDEHPRLAEAAEKLMVRVLEGL